MAWERRGGRSFYYRKLKVEGRVVSIYAGGGSAGAAAERMVAERRAAREKAAAARRAERERLDAEDRAASEGFAAIEALAHAALAAAGLYQRARGEWRRYHADV